MSWNDWHPQVRLAAAQALGKTGNGKVSNAVYNYTVYLYYLLTSYVY